MDQKKSESQSQFEINKVHNFQPCFEENASLFSRMFFIWTHELIRTGNSKHLEMDDLSDLKQNQQPEDSGTKFRNIFYSFGANEKKRFLKSFKKHIGITFIVSGILATIANMLQFSGPIVIGKVLDFLNSENPVISDGVFYVSILVLCYISRTFIMQHSMHFVNLSCIKVLNSANTLIFNKIIKLSSSSRKYLEAGTIMNNINVDVMSFYFFIMMSTFLFSAPCMILTAIVLLIVEVGWIGIVAPVLFLFGMIFQQKLMKKGFEMRKDQLFWSDKRSKCVNEYFSGIRIIKYYGWEKLVADKIENIRRQELILNFKVLMIRTYVEVVMNMLPIFSSIIIFGVFVAIEGEESLTSAKVYTVLSIFNLIATPMRLIVITLINFMNSQASLQRVQHFLGYEEKSLQGINFDDKQLKVGEINISEAKFNWETETAKKHYEAGRQLFKKNNKKDDKKDTKQEQKKKKPKKVKKSKVDTDGSKKKKKKKKKKNKERKSLITEESSLSQSLLQKSEETMETSSKSKYVLEIKKLKINKGEFVSVIGKVGSGKSTLLSAILGEIDKAEGRVNRRGNVAFIPQTSWLRSATIKQNILFESQLQEERYQKVLQISQLAQDLQILPGGDLTEIGEKGVNLSGGQKQRISIARALYANADIYIIDDCLSALDAYVGKNIFNCAIKEYLHNQGKTIVFVTNAIDYTEFTDRVLVMQNGKIIEDGAPLQLLGSENSFYKKLKVMNKNSKKQSEHEEEDKSLQLQKTVSEEEALLKVKLDDEQQKEAAQKQKQSQAEKKPKEVQGLVKLEQRLKGSVPIKFYIRFFSGPGKGKSLLMFFFILLAQGARVGSDWWLGQWSNNGFSLPQNTYIWIYSIISLVVGLLLYIKGIFFAKFIISTSRVIQRQLIQALLKTPLSWFDVTPTGRIIARSTKDQDDLDNSLSFNVQYAAQNIFVLISSVLLISIATPVYLIVAFISGIIYYKLVGMYMNSSRQIKRLQANTRAPLITHFQETINGIYVIRAFQKQQNFLQRYYLRQKYYIAAIVNQNITTRWINLMTDIFSVLTIAAAGYFGVITVAASIGTNNTSLIGLSLVWSLQISAIMSFTLRILADTESNMNAVVRLYDYIDNNPNQKDFEDPKPADSQWPNKGVYGVNNISYKYRPELPLVIKKISFDIKENAKIGIVGRTGSGKSTMTLGLLRILELAENEDGTMGNINLDNENVSDLGLHHLRHKITIIPQDPTLFTGTIKQNVDPFNQYSDSKIEDSLKKVGIWQAIPENEEERSASRKKIYSKVDQSGSNYSLGQRQLLCMARALIRNPKVLLMDQATASIDEKTDQIIQTMIRKEFTKTTVITIAHRLNTIIYYDKILVLDKGEVKEYDTPLKLVKNPNSFLGKLIRKVGKQFMEKIIHLAEEGEQNKLKKMEE